MSINDGYAHTGKLNEKIDTTISPTDKEADYNIQKTITGTAINVVWIKDHLVNNEKDIKELNGRVRTVEKQQSAVSGKFSVMFVGIGGIVTALGYIVMKVMELKP